MSTTLAGIIGFAIGSGLLLLFGATIADTVKLFVALSAGWLYGRFVK